MTLEQLAALKAATSAAVPDWLDTTNDRGAVAYWNEPHPSARVPLAEAWLSGRTLADLFGLLRAGAILRAIRLAGTPDTDQGEAFSFLYRLLVDTVGRTPPGIDLAPAGAWAQAQALFGAIGLNAETEVPVIEHFRTRPALRSEEAGFGPLTEADVIAARSV